MKHVHYLALIGFSALMLTACNPNTPNEPIRDSYPKKHLIEEFTGQDCGYCPYGMNCVHEFMENDTNWVLVLHHYGYKKDNFSVAGSKTITNALLGPNDGAPSITINRAKTKYKDEYGSNRNMVVFHPAYLETTSKSQFDETTYASINIYNSYNANTRELNVKVSGALSRKDVESLRLTVLVKESGMIDYQQDYYNTYEGWSEFRHTNAVRAFLTDEKGDEVIIRNQRYSDNFTITLKDKWVAENCMIVAFLSEDFQPVIQAEQRPVVEGSKGGADIQHGGITVVPVSDYYPEPDPVKGPSDYSGLAVDTFSYTSSNYQAYSNYGFNFWTIMSYNADYAIKVGNTTCVRFVDLYLFSSMDQTTLPTGTFELNTSMEPGTAWAGFRDDENFEISGSTYYYVNKAYFEQDYLVPTVQWLIANGTLTINENIWELEGHARNGAPIHLVGLSTKAKTPSLLFKAPKRQPKWAHSFEYCE